MAKGYAETAERAYAQGTDLPERVIGPAWAGEVTPSYAFHPTLISVSDKRLSTIPNFQRARGRCGCRPGSSAR